MPLHTHSTLLSCFSKVIFFVSEWIKMLHFSRGGKTLGLTARIKLLILSQTGHSTFEHSAIYCICEASRWWYQSWCCLWWWWWWWIDDDDDDDDDDEHVDDTGGDDVNQLCEAGEDEFLEIMALVGMASKPLHVRRLQKALLEWIVEPGIHSIARCSLVSQVFTHHSGVYSLRRCALVSQVFTR